MRVSTKYSLENLKCSNYFKGLAHLEKIIKIIKMKNFGAWNGYSWVRVGLSNGILRPNK